MPCSLLPDCFVCLLLLDDCCWFVCTVELIGLDFSQVPKQVQSELKQLMYLKTIQLNQYTTQINQTDKESTSNNKQTDKASSDNEQATRQTQMS